MKEYFKNYEGIVKSGYGYDQKRNWNMAKKIFQFNPFFGSLNILIKGKIILTKTQKRINPFEDWSCIAGKINEEDVWFCFDSKKERTELQSVFVVSQYKLRDKLNLKDGDRVNIKIKDKAN